MAEFGCNLSTCGIDTCGDGLPCDCICHKRETVPSQTDSFIEVLKDIDWEAKGGRTRSKSTPAPEAEGMEQRADDYAKRLIESKAVAAGFESAISNALELFARAEVVRALEGAEKIIQDNCPEHGGNKMYLLVAIRKQIAEVKG